MGCSLERGSEEEKKNARIPTTVRVSWWGLVGSWAVLLHDGYTPYC